MHKSFNKNSMKKQIIILAAMFLMGSAACIAQQPQGGPDMSKFIEQMVTNLGLNDTQAKDFKAAMAEMRPDMSSGEMPSREEMEKKMKAFDSKMKTILTADQYKKLQEMREKMGHGPRPDNN